MVKVYFVRGRAGGDAFLGEAGGWWCGGVVLLDEGGGPQEENTMPGSDAAGFFTRIQDPSSRRAVVTHD